MSEAILTKLEQRITAATETKDVLAYAKAYAEIEKADTDRMKIEATIQNDSARLQLEEAKLNADVEDKQRKATLEQTKADIDAIVRKTQLENDKLKIDSEIEEKQKKVILEQSKADIDATIRKTQLGNDKLKIDNDKEIQMAKIKASSDDNKMMAAALTGGIFLMYGIEKAGILLSRNAGSLLKFARFAKI